MLQFSHIQEIDFSRGVDQSSNTTAIQPGSVEDAVNIDPSGISLTKRTGFEKLAGDVPTILQGITTSGTTTTLTFPSTIELSAVSEESSLYLRGRMEYTTGFKEIDLVVGGFTRIDTYTLLSSGSSTVVNLAAELGVSSYAALVNIYNVLTGEIIYTNININPSTLNMTLSYSLDENLQVQFITKECPDQYASATTLDMTTEISIPAATHGFSNQLLPTIYKVNSPTDYELVLPDSLEIASSGDVTVNFLSTSPGDECQVILTECGGFVEGTTLGGDISTVVVIPAAESEFMIAACYMDEAGLGDYLLCLPDTVIYDSLNNQHRVTFTHGGTLTNYKVVYTYGAVATNRCTVENLVDTTSPIGAPLPSETPTRFLVAVTGLNNEQLSAPPSVNFIDKYEVADETIIASSGQLFRTFDPAITEAFDIRNRLANNTYIGPTFTSAHYPRSLGCIVSSAATGAGYLRVTSITNISGRNFLVTITAPAHTVLDSSGAPTSLASVLPSGSRITLSGSRVALFNDSFEIAAPTSLDADTLTFTINVPAARLGSRDNDNESGALAGIFTDKFTFQTDALFAAEDIITLSPTADCVAVSTNVNDLLVDGVEEKIDLYTGQRLGPTASKSSIVVPGFSLLVAGDIVTAGGIVTRITSAEEGISSTELRFRDEVPLSDGQITVVCPLRWEVIRPADTFLGTAPVSTSTPLRSVAGKGSLYISGGVKYDGDKVYTSGVPSFQMFNHIGIDESAGSQIVVSTITATINNTTIPNTVVTTTTASDAGKFNVGDKILLRTSSACDQTEVYTIDKIDTTTGAITLNKNIHAANLTKISTFISYRYFARLSLLDRNGNLAVSNSLGQFDLLARLTSSAAVHLTGTVFPEGIDPIDYDNLYVDIFRARETQTELTNFYRVGSINLSNESLQFMFTDATPDIVAEVDSNLDQIKSPILGDVGSVRGRLPRSAAFLTSINNQLVVGNYLGDNKARVQFTGSASYSALRGEDVDVVTTSGTHTFSVVSSGGTSVTPAVSGTTVTLTHGAITEIAAGQIILLARAAKEDITNSPLLLGWHTVIAGGSTTTTKFTLTDAPGSFTSAESGSIVMYHVAGKFPLVHDLAYAPISGSALSSTSIADGFSLHLAQAINALLAPVGITAAGGKGQTNFELTVVGNTLISVDLPTVTGLSYFCNGRLGLTSSVAGATSFSSRVAMSIKGAPEVFDSLEVSDVSTLPTVQDVNPEDGESVIMALPFFATAAFGAAQQSNALLILKDHGAYLLDPQAKYAGSTDVFKQLDTSGYGCECPLSVINSQVGILFANTTGIYLIDRQFKFTRIGDRIDGYISSGVFTPSNSTAAVNDITGGKLLFTSGMSTLAFHLPDVDGGAVGWTRYEGIPATMWAHRDNAAIFATSSGYVGILTDRYADAGAAITSTILLRNIDAGMPTLKKVLRHATVVISSDTDYAEGELSASMAVDFSNNFEAMDTCKLVGTEATYVDGLSDYIRPSMQMVSFSAPTVKAGWYQMKIISSKLGAGFTLARVVFRVAGIRERADRQAAETK